jgi:hypothetical protein
MRRVPGSEDSEEGKRLAFIGIQCNGRGCG